MIEDKHNPDIQVNDLIEGFRVLEGVYLPKLHLFFYRLEHEATGAQMIHLSNDDDNNCFGIAFRTTPRDSTGVAHILEHTALCGSEKFPVRDPFFSMVRRSMKTFMNAFTASDWTMYPFSTQNPKDFENLMQVYLDAAFFPRLAEKSFRQEGHRLEFEKLDDPETPLTIKGIVYNEMKGAMSSQSSLMYRRVAQALYPTITYGFNSGGEPKDIPDLTWEDLKNFHHVHYHPSNAYFYSYGDQPLRKHLAVIQTELSRFDRIDPKTEVVDEQRYSEPQAFRFTYPLVAEEDDGNRSQVALAWLMSNVKEPVEILSLQLIELILLGNAASPLRKALLESQIGKALADTTGFEDDMRETFFSVGLQGIAEQDADKVVDLILSTLEALVKKGIDPNMVESAIHQMEIGTREISGGHYPYSLNLLFRFFGCWVHGGNPLAAIDFDENLALIKQEIEKGPYLENQIRKYFLENFHRATIVLSPDSEQEVREQEELKEKLAKKKAGLSPQEKEIILRESLELKHFQEEEENLTCLPTLEIADIPTSIRHVDPLPDKIEGLDVTFYDQPTNGLVYVSWLFNMEHLSPEEREWLPLMGYLLTSSGADGLSYDALSSLVARYTGGFSAGADVQVDLFDSSKISEYFTLSSKSLARNQGKMFELAGKFLTGFDFADTSRMKTLIFQRTNALVNSISQSGHSYAASMAKRGFSLSCKIDEIYSGVHQVQFMKKLADTFQHRSKEITEKMAQLAGSIFDRNKLSLMVIGEKENFEQTKALILQSVTSIPEKVSSPIEWPAFSEEKLKEIWTTTTPVSYVAKCFTTPGYIHEDSPKLLLLAGLLKSCYLHGEIREKGGAYGGMASYNAEEGVFSLLSYRDPHLSRTMKVYDGALDWLKSGKFTEEDVKQAILQTCSALDTPLSPAGKAAMEYQNLKKGKTVAMRNNFRKGVLNATGPELVAVAERWLSNEASVVAITGEEKLREEQPILNTFGMVARKI